MFKFNGSWHKHAKSLKNNLIRIMSFRDIREYNNVKLDRNLEFSIYRNIDRQTGEYKNKHK